MNQLSSCSFIILNLTGFLLDNYTQLLEKLTLIK